MGKTSCPLLFISDWKVMQYIIEYQKIAIGKDLFRKILTLAFILLGLQVRGQFYQTSEIGPFQIKHRLWDIKNELPHWKTKGVFRAQTGFVYLKSGPYLLRFNGRNLCTIDTIPSNDNWLTYFGEDQYHNIWTLDGKRLHLILKDQDNVFPYHELYDQPLPFELQPESQLFSVEGLVHLYDSEKSRLWIFEGEQWKLLLHPQKRSSTKAYSPSFMLPKGAGLWWHFSGDTLSFIDQKRDRVLKTIALTNSEAGYMKDVFEGDSSYFISSQPEPLSANTRDLQFSFTVPRAVSLNPIIQRPNYDIIQDHANHEIILQSKDSRKVLLSEALKVSLKPLGATWGLPHNIVELDDHHYLIPLSQQRGILEIRIQKQNWWPVIRDKSLRHINLLHNSHLAITQLTPKTETLLYEENASGFRLRPEGSVFLDSKLMGSFEDQLFLESSIKKSLYSWSEANGFDTILKNLPNSFGEGRTLNFLNDSLFAILWEHNLSLLNRFNKDFSTIKSFPTNQEGLCLSLIDENLWVGTRDGLYHSETDSIYLSELGNQNLEIAHIYKDPHGFFWLATNRGLLKWRPFASNIMAWYNIDSGLAGNGLHAVYPDTLGRLWLSANEGIICLDTNTGQVRNFTEADGLLNSEQNYLAHQQGQDGVLYFGGLEGLVIFDPNGTNINDYGNTLLSSSLKFLHLKAKDYNGKTIEVPPLNFSALESQIIELPANNAVLSLTFDFPHYRQEELNFFWRIPEQGDAWISFDLNNELTLFDPPKNYFDLELKISSPAGSLAERVFSYHFHRKPLFYETVWFIVLMVVFLIAAMLLIIRHRSRLILAQKERLRKEVLEQTRTLEKQNDLIEQKNIALAKASESKNQMFRNISHEFRTPLSIISSELYQISQASSLKQADLSIIEQQTGHLKKMVNDIASLSSDKNNLELSRKETELAWPNDFKEFLGSFESVALKGDQIYNLNINPTQPYQVWLDQEHFQKIANNLISNAFKFTPAQGRITVDLELNSNELSLKVSDNGPGIAIAEQAKVFERYFQGSLNENNANPGFGLGLSLCKQSAELLGGQLELESEPELGSTFTLSLPVRSQVLDDKPKVNNPVAYRSEPTSELPHILVVEDNLDMLKSLSGMLNKNCQVSVAADGDIAWRLLQKHPSIDLIISDVMMPKVSGFTLLSKVRQDKLLKAKPFLILSALGDQEDLQKALILGVDAYMVKPFEPQELKLRVRNLLDQQRLRQSFRAQITAAPKKNRKGEEDFLSFDEKWLRELETVIDENLNDSNLKVPDLADMLHLSERGLYNKVKLITGLSPAAYLRRIRLNRAKVLLLNRQYATVKEVAYAVGFSDLQNFRKQYKKEFGHAPSEARNAPKNDGV